MTSPTWPDKRRRASNGRRARLSRWFAIAGAIATAGTGVTVAASAAGPTAQSQMRPHISGSWMLQNPGTTVALQGAAFVSPTEGYVVGAGGTVLRTVDGGANWNQVASGTLTELHAVTAVPTPGCTAGSGTCVWVAGLAGTVRFSSDAGGTWCTQAAPTSSYNAIGNNGPNDIFIAGSHGTIARGGGAGCGGSYTKYSGTASTDDLDGLAVTTAGALSDGHLGTIYRDTGASTLTVAPDTSGTSAALEDVVETPHKDYAVGSAGTILAATPGPPPVTWSAQSSGTGKHLYGVFFADDNNGWAVGSGGTILATTNGGASWTPQQSPTTALLHRIVPARNSNGAVVALYAVGNGGTIITLGGPPPAVPITPGTGPGAGGPGSNYWTVASDGGVFSFGPNAQFFGSMGGKPLNKPIVGMAEAPGGLGYWLVASDGGVFSFGPNAQFFGSMGGKPLNKPIVGIAAAANGQGYYLVASDGGIFTFGPGAQFFGSMGGKPLNSPMIGMAASSDGFGYWTVAADGGVFTFGPSPSFFGSMGGTHLNAPVVGMAATTGGDGYWLDASDGGVFTFGPGAQFFGSMGGKRLNKPVVGMASPSSDGYWLDASDGGIFTFGPGVQFAGSMGGKPLNAPMVGMSAAG